MIICYITFYLSNISFKTLQKFISHWNFVQMKWFKFIFKKNSIMYMITFISFESLKSFEQKKSWISLFNNISLTILLKNKSLRNG